MANTLHQILQCFFSCMQENYFVGLTVVNHFVCAFKLLNPSDTNQAWFRNLLLQIISFSQKDFIHCCHFPLFWNNSTPSAWNYLQTVTFLGIDLYHQYFFSSVGNYSDIRNV